MYWFCLSILHTVSHSGCTSQFLLHILTSRHFSFLFFFMRAILTSERRHIIVVLICISFSCVCCSSVCLLCKKKSVYSGLLPIFQLGCLVSFFFFWFLGLGWAFLCCWTVRVVYVFWILTPYQIICKYFLPFSRLSSFCQSSPLWYQSF